MMWRRWAMCVPLAVLTSWLLPQTGKTAEVADLKEQLEDGLRARRSMQLRFIARVVNLVEDDRLPLSLVKGVFQWSVRKAGRKHPFPYFERAMRIQARKLGVII